MIKAYPGCYLVELLEEEKNADKPVFSTEKKGRLLKGKILHVGEPMEQKSGGVLKGKLKEGQTIIFLSYEGDYDNIEIDDKKYYFVLFEDGRGYLE